MHAVELKHIGDDSLAASINGRLLEKRYIFGKRPGLNLFRIDPAFTVPEVEISGFLKTFEAILSQHA